MKYLRARKLCTAAAVKTEALLEACTLDNAVLKDAVIQRFEQNGRLFGRDLDHWLRAEHNSYRLRIS